MYTNVNKQYRHIEHIIIRHTNDKRQVISQYNIEIIGDDDVYA